MPPLTDNPLHTLQFESPFFQLGPDYFDVVQAAPVTGLKLRWRNPDLFEQLGVDLSTLRDQQLLDAFGHFSPLPQIPHPPLAQRYIGFQFRQFNPQLGDGRGFLLGQVRTPDGRLIDLGTKGSGQTPWSRGGDGRLTLKGGVREIIAAEFLHALGIKTSRALTVIEHDDKLWRGDEPSPTRASILVRAGEAHVRFGTFERYFYLVQDPTQRQKLLSALADHVVDTYYPAIRPLTGEERVLALYDALLDRVALTCAGWVGAGFAHGVLNTDNMNITGDSFDYGPFAFMEHYDPDFTAAYFDSTGLYAFESQPDAVYWNLAMLTRPFGILAPAAQLETLLHTFPQRYRDAFRRVLLPRLGFVDQGSDACRMLLKTTLQLLRTSRCHYHGFFRAITDVIGTSGLPAEQLELPTSLWSRSEGPITEHLSDFLKAWQERLKLEPEVGRLDSILHTLRTHNPVRAPYRPEIERVWAAITDHDDWGPFYTWIEELRHPFQ